MPTTGLFRVRGKSGLPDEVKVDAAGNEVFESEKDYIRRGRQPSLTDLPWEDEYAQQQKSILMSAQPNKPEKGN